MSVETSSPQSEPSTSSQPIYEIWVKALTQPGVETYENIASDPNATALRGFLWVFLSYLIGSLISALGVTFLGSLSTLLGDQSAGIAYPALSGLSLLCIAPFGALFGVLFLIIIAGISNAIARALGGTGNFDRLTYTFAAYIAPLTLIGSLVGMVPILNCLTIPLSLYGLFLNILAIKAVHDIGWGKAVLSSIVILAGILIFVAFVVIILLALLGPTIGNVFSNIIEEMGTPVP